MAAGKTFSIVLCTRDRARLLERALESLLGIDYPQEDFELVLVDNASSDRTPELAAAFAKRAPFAVHVVRETRIGLSAARNRGVREASGRYVLFTDDDQLVDPAILGELRRVAERHAASVVQGAIELRFAAPCPAWLTGKLREMLGETPERPEGPGDIELFGGNLLVRRDVFDKLEGFREDLGKGRAGYSEDSELGRRLRAGGHAVAFAPGARIYHVIEADRTTRAFFRRMAYAKGRSHGLLDKGQAWPSGRVGYLARYLRGTTPDALRATLRGEERAMQAQVDVAFSLGQLVSQAGDWIRATARRRR